MFYLMSGHKKWSNYHRNQIEYTPEGCVQIDERRKQISEDNPKLSETEIAVWEVLDRFQGENGLSVGSVNRLGSAIMNVIESMYE